MKSLELIKKFLRLFGIAKCSQDGSDRMIGTVTNCVACTVYTVYVCITLRFFACEAQTFFEYSESFFFILCAILMSIWYQIYLRQRTKYSELIEDLIVVVEKSKRNFTVKCTFLNIKFFHSDYLKLLFSMCAPL